MEKFRIEGGSTLKGTIRASGAKNAVLPLMAASLLIPEKVILRDVPEVADVYTMAELLKILGVEVEPLGGGRWKIDAKEIKSTKAPYELVKKMRASIYVLGPLLIRKRKAEVSLPGGCAFGPRPVDFHIGGLTRLGADLKIEHGYIVGTAQKLKGTTITFDKKSVGATAHLMMAASLIPGKTVLSNSALEPEVETLREFLTKAGAQIERVNGREIVIEGVKTLHSPGEFKVIPDRIEVGTYAVAALMTNGDVKIENCKPEHLRTVLEKLEIAGAKIEEGENYIRVGRGSEEISPLNIYTAPYPGFPTDMQAQFMALLTLAEGTSVIQEGIYPDRFNHAFELVRLGADISVEGDTAIIKGVKKLTGAPVMASDLRASAALVLAGLVATGTTTIDRIYHLDRGYEKFDEKLKILGAKIERFRE